MQKASQPQKEKGRKNLVTYLKGGNRPSVARLFPVATFEKHCEISCPPRVYYMTCAQHCVENVQQTKQQFIGGILEHVCENSITIWATPCLHFFTAEGNSSIEKFGMVKPICGIQTERWSEPKSNWSVAKARTRGKPIFFCEKIETIKETNCKRKEFEKAGKGREARKTTKNQPKTRKNETFAILGCFSWFWGPKSGETFVFPVFLFTNVMRNFEKSGERALARSKHTIPCKYGSISGKKLTY